MKKINFKSKLQLLACLSMLLCAVDLLAQCECELKDTTNASELIKDIKLKEYYDCLNRITIIAGGVKSGGTEIQNGTLALKSGKSGFNKSTIVFLEREVNYKTGIQNNVSYHSELKFCFPVENNLEPTNCRTIITYDKKDTIYNYENIIWLMNNTEKYFK